MRLEKDREIDRPNTSRVFENALRLASHNCKAAERLRAMIAGDSSSGHCDNMLVRAATRLRSFAVNQEQRAGRNLLLNSTLAIARTGPGIFAGYRLLGAGSYGTTGEVSVEDQL